MKKGLFVLIVIASVVMGAFCAKAVEFYPYCNVGFNGSVSVYNDGSYKVSIVDETLYYGSAKPADYVRVLPSGDELYRTSRDGYGGYIEYVVSSDRKHMCQIAYMFGDWTWTTWLTSSYNEQQSFYRKNRHNQSSGFSFDFSSEDNSSSSSSRRSSNGSCSTCGGTGIDPQPTSCYGYTSWLAVYNPDGQRCNICGKYDEHYHSRCSHCSVPNH